MLDYPGSCRSFRREGAYESVGLPCQDTLVVGDGIVGAHVTLCASRFGYGCGEDLSLAETPQLITS